MKIKSHLDFEQIAQLLKVKIHNSTTANEPPAVAGGLYFNTTTGKFMWSNGTSWFPIDDVSSFINLLVANDGIKFTAGTGGNEGKTIIDVDINTNIFEFTGTAPNKILSIKNLGILGAHIANSATVDDDRAITTNHIKDSAVTTAKIADANVTTEKIADNNVTLAKLAKMNKLKVIGRGDQGAESADAAAVTIDIAIPESAPTNDDSIASTKAIRAAIVAVSGAIPSVVGGDAIDVSLAGTQYTVKVDATDQFEVDANKKLQVAENKITGRELSDHASTDANRAVSTNHIKDSAVTTEKINNGAVNFDKIASAIVITSAGDGLGGTVDDVTLATSKAIVDFINDTVGDLGTLISGWNADTNNVFPSKSGDPVPETRKGDYWYVTHAGTIQGIEFTVGSMMIAKQNSPSTTLATDWIFLISKMGAASTTKLGLVKYATQALVDAATSDDTVVRPATLKTKITTAGTTITKEFGFDIVRRFSTDIGNNSATDISVTHNFGTKDVNVEVYENSTDEKVLVDVTRTNTNVVTIGFAAAPATNAYRVVIAA